MKNLTDISILTNKALEKLESENGTENKNDDSFNKKKISTVTKYDVYDFAQTRKIDEADAIDCFNMNKQRNFKDRNGKPIKSLFGAIYNYCKQKKFKRSNSNGQTQ